MNDSAALRALDNPVWSSLTTCHAHFAQGDHRARRYPRDISPIVGLPGVATDTVTALEAVVPIDDDMAIAGPFVPKLPSNWEVLHESFVTQMIRGTTAPLADGGIEASMLGPDDVPGMLALVELTHPGPFRPRTIELGCFIGIREGGQLVAMAGERMWTGSFREVSGVCTHPDVQGRGYAKALIARVVNRMLSAGQTPFLHVESPNTRAIDVYRALGFVRRAEYPLLYAKRTA